MKTQLLNDAITTDSREIVIDFVKETGAGVPINELLQSVRTFNKKF